MFKYFYYALIIVISLTYGCGKQGPEGKKSLIVLIKEPPGANCATGGYKIVSGIDQNGNNILDASEIQTTSYICNGANGSNSLASLVAEVPGPNCSTGGYKLNTGIDLNNNNVLDPSEITNTQYICNGATGNNSLVALVTEPAGLNCPTGGYKVNSGVDVNKNGILEANEVQSSTYICNGNTGFTSLIAIQAEPSGNNCTYGGYRFNTGIDVNKNKILDTNEVTGTTFICNNSAIHEVRIPLDYSANTTSTTGVSGLALSGFNKANYTGLDSIVFSARPYTGDISSNSIVDLLDMTDNLVLDSSRLMSNQLFNNALVQRSSNLYNFIPNKPIDIGLRVRSQISGSFAASYGTSYLIIY